MWRVTDIDGSSTKSISAQAFGECKRTKRRLPAPGTLDFPETDEKKRDPRSDTKDNEGPPSDTALPHRHGLRPGKPKRAPLRSKSDGRRRHPGTRASRPHALPLRAAQFPRDAAPGHPAYGDGMESAEAES